MHEISRGSIKVSDYVSRLERAGAGSVVIHEGICKGEAEGRGSEGVSFEETGDALAEIGEVEKALRAEFDILDVILVKRSGRVAVGETILLAAVAAKDRVNSFGACRRAVEMCKKLKTLTKTEHYVE